MSEERTPMQPALGLVKGRVGSLPPRTRTAPTTATAAAEASPELAASPVNDLLLAERAKEAEFEAALAETAKTPPVEDDNTARSKPKTKRPKATQPANGTPEGERGTKRTTLSLPQELVDRMTERRKSTPKVGQVQFILNALAETHDRLAKLIQLDKDGEVGNNLFPVTKSVRADVGKRTTISFDTATENMEVIDSLVTSSGAESRSQLVRVALRDVLEA